MNFEEFTELLKEAIKEELPEEYRDIELSMTEVTTANKSYRGLCFQFTDEANPVFDLDEIYRMYRTEPSFWIEEAAQGIANAAVEASERMKEMNNALGILSDSFDEARKKIVLRATSAEKDFLKDTPHETIGDIAISAALLIDDNSDGYYMTALNNELCRNYGITGEEALEAARENCSLVNPPFVKRLSDMLGIPIHSEREPYVFTTLNGEQGAGAFFAKGSFELAAETVRENFWAIPASVHEFILMPECLDLTPEELKGIIRHANDTVVSKEEILSYSLYHYDVKERLFEPADEYIRRTDISRSPEQLRSRSERAGMDYARDDHCKVLS